MRRALPLLFFLASSTAFGAFPDDWNYKQAITVPASVIDSDLTDFTVRVTREMLHDDVVDPSGVAADTSQANGGDIRFSSDAAGTTQLAADLINWEHDTTTGADDAEILVSVKVSSLTAASGGTFYIWFGTSGTDTQPARTDTYGRDNAYDSSWEGFYPTAYTTDRTVNDLNGTANGGMTDGGATGPLGSTPATDFDGNDDYILFTTGVPTVEPVTVILWAEPDDATNWRTAWHLGDTDVNDQHDLDFRGNTGGDPIQASTYDASSSATSSSGSGYTANTWHQAAGVFSSDTSRTAYLDGTAGTEDTTSRSPTSIDRMIIGTTYWSGSYIQDFDGALALVEVHSAARSAAWINAAYENISAPATFGAPGTPAAHSGGGSGALLFNQQAD